VHNKKGAQEAARRSPSIKAIFPLGFETNARANKTGIEI